MNLLGKIFTVVIFLLSIGASTIALMVYSAHSGRKNWMNVTIERKAEQDTEKAKNASLIEEKKSLEAQLKREVELAQSRLADLESQYMVLRKERGANNELIRSKEVEIGKLAASVRDSHAELETLRGIAVNLRASIRSTLADRDDRFQQILTRTDEFHNVIAELERLQKQNMILQDELQEMESQTR